MFVNISETFLFRQLASLKLFLVFSSLQSKAKDKLLASTTSYVFSNPLVGSDGFLRLQMSPVIVTFLCPELCCGWLAPPSSGSERTAPPMKSTSTFPGKSFYGFQRPHELRGWLRLLCGKWRYNLKGHIFF